MAAGIGTLKAMLVLDTSQWGLAFAGASKVATGFGVGALSKAGGLVVGFGRQLLGAAVAATSVDLSVRGLGESMTHVASLSSTAKRLGLTVETTQKLGIAADQTGVDLDRLSHFVLIMGKNIGSGGMSLDKRLFMVADQVNKIKDPAERAAVAFKVFGKGGFEMINLLAKGGEGIRRSADAVDRFGLAIRDVDAAKVKEAKLALLELKTVLGGFRDLVAVEVAPTVTRFVSTWLDGLEIISRKARGTGDDLGKMGQTGNRSLWDFFIGSIAHGGNLNQGILNEMQAMRNDSDRNRKLGLSAGGKLPAGLSSGLSGGATGHHALSISGAAEKGTVEAGRIAQGGGAKAFGEALKPTNDRLDKLIQINRTKSGDAVVDQRLKRGKL